MSPFWASVSSAWKWSLLGESRECLWADLGWTASSLSVVGGWQQLSASWAYDLPSDWNGPSWYQGLLQRQLIPQ